jgi:hypothetical protein
VQLPPFCEYCFYLTAAIVVGTLCMLAYGHATAPASLPALQPSVLLASVRGPCGNRSLEDLQAFATAMQASYTAFCAAN